MINGISVNQFFENLVHVEDHNKTTFAHLIFVEPVVVGSFHLRGEWDGISMHGVGDQVGQSIDTNPLGMYHRVGVALVNDVQSKKN